MPIDVPAHVQYEHFVENNVVVLGGNNWDFSRRARVTPIVSATGDSPVSVVAADASDAPGRVVSPTTSAALAASKSAMTAPTARRLALIEFSPEEVVIGDADREALLRLPKDLPLRVAAYGEADESDAERLSRVRAEAVAAYLRSKGYTVEHVDAHGSVPPAAQGAFIRHNRVAEVFAVSEDSTRSK